ncbi:MAG TPA: radical SAM protein [Rhizomicrobium sp.]|nr:radical SAM protein [Rhizomicrobium sp.]
MTVVIEARLYNRKNQEPHRATHSPDGTHYRCAWIEDSITIHSDGNISCGLDDPHGQRSFGNIRTQSVAEIFANPEYRRVQEALWRGRRCMQCGHYRPERRPDQQINARPALPTRLVVETTVTCNIRCPNLPCFANNDPNETTRDEKMLSLETFSRMVDELAPNIATVNFYNYGEPFMNRAAEDMLAYLRDKNPDAFIVTSTNGIPLSNPARARKVAAARPNRVTFTISGTDQESYVRYHIGGRFEQAFGGMANVCAAKRELGLSRPQVVWRYLVFNWNDSDAEIERAVAMASEIGVDRLSLYLTNTPPGSRSIRFSPGSPNFWKYSGLIHLDDEGELNHIYRVALPDSDGLYPPETLDKFGRIRWTSSRARLRLPAGGGTMRLAVTSNRTGKLKQPCILHTPWRQIRIPAYVGQWNDVEIPVPSRFLEHRWIECELTVPGHWYPAENPTSNDLRCLGVMVRDDPGLNAAASAGRTLALPAALDPQRAATAPDYLHVLPRHVA